MNHLPDFLVIGSARCGTSSLHRNLCRHPRIRGPKGLRGNGKEVHFFDKKWGSPKYDLDWYQGLFVGNPQECYFFESTPNYIFMPSVPGRVREILPDGRFIAMLRDPVDRAWSHFCHWRRKCSWKISDLENPKFNPIEKGIYHVQLKRWFNVFDRDQFLIIRSEDFYSNPSRILKDVFRWIGVDPILIENPVYWDPAPGRDRLKKRVEYEKIPVNLGRKLRAFYRSHNGKLEELIGKRMGWDRSSSYEEER